MYTQIHKKASCEFYGDRVNTRHSNLHFILSDVQINYIRHGTPKGIIPTGIISVRITLFNTLIVLLDVKFSNSCYYKCNFELIKLTIDKVIQISHNRMNVHSISGVWKMAIDKTDKRQIILDTTLALVAERGLHDTPMSLISKEANVSVGAIYNYFESKEMLINTLYIEVKQSMKSVHCNIEGSVDEKFIQLWINTYQFLIENPHVVSFKEQCANSPIITESTKSLINQFYEPSIAFIQEGIDSGIFKPIKLSLILEMVYGLITMTIRSQLDRNNSLNADEVLQIAQFCLDGLKR